MYFMSFSNIFGLFYRSEVSERVGPPAVPPNLPSQVGENQVAGAANLVARRVLVGQSPGGSFYDVGTGALLGRVLAWQSPGGSFYDVGTGALLARRVLVGQSPGGSFYDVETGALLAQRVLVGQSPGGSFYDAETCALLARQVLVGQSSRGSFYDVGTGALLSLFQAGFVPLVRVAPTVVPQKVNPFTNPELFILDRSDTETVAEKLLSTCFSLNNAPEDDDSDETMNTLPLRASESSHARHLSKEEES
jgi:hypothetical protein